MNRTPHNSNASHAAAVLRVIESTVGLPPSNDLRAEWLREEIAHLQRRLAEPHRDAIDRATYLECIERTRRRLSEIEAGV